MGILKRSAAAGTLAALLSAGLPLLGAPPSPPGYSEEEIKSAMLYNFTKFVEWPAGVLGSGAPLVIGVLGGDPMIPVLEAVLRDKAVFGHPVVVRRLDSGGSPRTCAVLLVGLADRTETARILQSVAHSPVLTIGERAEFSRLGGVIAFIREGQRVHFQINLDAANRAGLHISSKLLRLAKLCREPEN